MTSSANKPTGQYVERHEFAAVSELVHETAGSVKALVTQVETLTSDVRSAFGAINKVADAVAVVNATIAAVQKPQGIDTRLLLSSVVVFLAMLGVFGTIGKFYVDGNVLHVESKADNNYILLDKISERQGEVRSRLTELETRQAGLQSENETQHRWIADLLAIETDWMQRVSQAHIIEGRIVIPARSVNPLQRVGGASIEGRND